MTASPTIQSPILIVDDDPLVIDLGRRILARAGYKSVDAITEPARAVERCASFEPDVMLLDLHMPDLDGFGVMAALKNSTLAHKPAIIMLTGTNDTESRIKAYEQGAHDYVTKPFIARELLARVSNTAESVRLRRHLEDAVAERTVRLEGALAILRQAEGQLRKQLDKSEAASQSNFQLLMETIHELRTPLNSVMGFSEALTNQLFGQISQPRYVEYAGIIHESGRHLVKLVDNLLDLAHAESDQERLDISEVNFGAVVEETATMLTAEAESAGVTLDVRIHPDLARIRTDATKLRQIVLNLGSNAVKYTPRGGHVTIEAKPDIDGGAMLIIVRDTGQGIAPEHLDLVMKPYGRTPQARMSGIKGTGLGLPLTRRYVEMLGGTLDLASVPGRGTVVTVRLPANAEQPAVASEAAARSA